MPKKKKKATKLKKEEIEKETIEPTYCPKCQKDMEIMSATIRSNKEISEYKCLNPECQVRKIKILTVFKPKKPENKDS